MTSENTRIPILFASGNRHKTAEIQALLGQSFVVRDLSIFSDYRSPAESGGTFEANALIKAETAALNSPLAVLADDSGLEVDALGGAPGIHTARFAGPDATDEENRAKLLSSLDGQSNRSARFVCVLAFIEPGRPAKIFRGEIRGTVSTKESGAGGFGYDPLFIPDGFSESFAELAPEIKNTLSHRAIATRKFLDSVML